MKRINQTFRINFITICFLGLSLPSSFGQSADISAQGKALKDSDDKNRVSIGLSTSAETMGNGFIWLQGANGDAKVLMRELARTNGAYGSLATYGPGGVINVSMGTRQSANVGEISIADVDGSIKAFASVDDNGGFIVADRMITETAKTQSLRLHQPYDEKHDLVVTSLIGLEDVVYSRGTVLLEDGEAEVSFDQLYSDIINPDDMTIVLTPNSPTSQGLAVVEKYSNGFKVKELRKGEGTYEFDWEVKACRKGQENYQKLQPTLEHPHVELIDKMEVPKFPVKGKE